jgi:ATP/ADP translocase
MNGLKILNIKQSEAKPILMLIGYSFFMGLSIAFYFTATISDFLTNFDIINLPYTYILSGVLGYLLWLVWSYLEKKVQFTTRLMLGITFLVITVALQWVGVLCFYKAWISFVMLVWVRVFIFVNMVNFWGMAGKLFNLSQGKRLFGIISVGTVISDIFGFFSIPFILLLGLGNPELIFLALIALLICLIITFQITRVLRDQLSEQTDQTQQSNPNEKVSKREPLFKNKYQQYLFILAILPMFGFYFVDYLFLHQIQLEFQHSTTALAEFMGIFFGVMAIFELLVKTSLFSRLINNFGLKVVLLALPGILLITVVLTITIGLFAGTLGFLFSLIAFIKLLEKVLRSGVNDPSFQILYQPIPSHERLAFQSKMEGIPTALGNIMAGALILLLVHFGFTGAILYNVIFFVVLIFWCYMTLALQKEYRNVIVNNLSDLSEESGVNGNPLVSLTESFTEGVEDKSESEIIKTLSLVKNIGFNHSIDLLHLLVDHPSYKVREAVIRMINKNKLTAFIPQLEKSSFLKSGNPGVSDLVRATGSDLSNHNIFSDESIHSMMDSESEETKLKLLECVKNTDNDVELKKVIEKLILDDQHSVVNGALNLIPKPLDQANATLIVQALENMHLSHLANQLLNEKNPFVEKLLVKKLQQLESGLWSDLNSQLLSIHIISILGNIAGEDSQNYLVKLLNSSTSEIGYFVTRSLDKSGYRAIEEDKIMFIHLIEEEVSFCTWLLASKQDLIGMKNEASEMITCLQGEYNRATEKIFAFLSFVYPRNTIQQIRSNLKAESTVKNVLGFEMCELIFSDTLKSILIPVFSNNPENERVKLLIKEFSQQRLSPMRRLENIVYHNFTKVNAWLKILATDIISKNTKLVPKEIFANLHINNPAIKESAYLAIHKINQEEFYKRIGEEQNDYRLYFDKLLGNDPVLGKKDSIFESVNKLKGFTLFGNLHEIVLIKLATLILKIDLSETDFYCKEYGSSTYVHFVDRGSLHLLNSGNDLESDFEKGDMFGLFDAYNLRDIDFEAAQGTQLLAIDAEYFFQLVSIYDELSEALMEHFLVLGTSGTSDSERV